ncbi:helix-turn-helix transcriptional regulator [Limosilactobacillus fermentum]|uniref:Transcriptional regulator n=1 Tax=Lactobacillus phage LFP01 TaxID=3051505 RepID=A0AAX3XGX1_9CAUD|nr:helix-turn-helix transcriptional regulator [Limosilactobacillus fermentum]MCT3428543.1 XRE family transcriptional regulator [Limosilactobacillus fermentum]MCT3443836.1 XRE family transcriptional regulator [Limosilactobacillus fermentum]MDU5750004.1 helix-turn-helix transcriptional regulator [Limosilactobacillus fermentum]
MTDLIPTEVKHTIKDLRVRAGLSQSEASKRLGVTEPTLRKWENDSSVLSFRQMKEIASLYHIPLDYIFFGDDNAFSEK